MKKILILLSFLLLSMVGISQMRYHSTNRLDYGKLVRVGFTYELIYPDFHAWDLYILSGLDIDFWVWYDQYHVWRFKPFISLTFDYYRYPYDYWYMRWWGYYWGYHHNYWYYYNYNHYWHHNNHWNYGINQHKPNNTTYGKRPVNRPVNIDNTTRPKPNINRIREPERDSKPIREDRVRRENNRIGEPERITKPKPERERPINPTYRQPERESRPRYNDTRIRENENNKPNRVEQSKPINNQRESGDNKNSGGERKR